MFTWIFDCRTIEFASRPHAGPLYDARSGEAVRAFVVLREPAPTHEELVRHCRASLAAYKVPREFVIRAQLPKSAVGKILRAELKD